MLSSFKYRNDCNSLKRKRKRERRYDVLCVVFGCRNALMFLIFPHLPESGNLTKCLVLEEESKQRNERSI